MVPVVAFSQKTVQYCQKNSTTQDFWKNIPLDRIVYCSSSFTKPSVRVHGARHEFIQCDQAYEKERKMLWEHSAEETVVPSQASSWTDILTVLRRYKLAYTHTSRSIRRACKSHTSCKILLQQRDPPQENKESSVNRALQNKFPRAYW